MDKELVGVPVFLFGIVVTFFIFYFYENQAIAKGKPEIGPGPALIASVLWPLSLACFLVIAPVLIFSWCGKQVWRRIMRHVVSPLQQRRLQRQTQIDELNNQQERFQNEGIPFMWWKG